MTETVKRMAQDDGDQQVKRQRLEKMLDCTLVSTAGEKISAHRLDLIREFKSFRDVRVNDIVKLDADKETLETVINLLANPRVPSMFPSMTYIMKIWKFAVRYGSDTLLPQIKGTYLAAQMGNFSISQMEYNTLVDLKEEFKMIAECYLTAPTAITPPPDAKAFWQAVHQVDYKLFKPDMIIDRIISKVIVPNESLDGLYAYFTTLSQQKISLGFKLHADNPYVVSFMKALMLRIFG